MDGVRRDPESNFALSGNEAFCLTPSPSHRGFSPVMEVTLEGGKPFKRFPAFAAIDSPR